MDLLEKEPQSDDVRRYLSIIENRTKTLETLTEELFRYSIVTSSKEEFIYEKINVNAVLEECIAAYYPTLMACGINPNIVITDQKIERVLDKNALMRVLGNILSNAIKYSDDGDLKIGLMEKGILTFTNMASKLNNTEVQKLFNRFYTVETTRNSTGLGLFIAKKLMEKMNESIGANYKDGKLKIEIVFVEER